MEASDLLTSLAKLENSLSEIESAKNQVKQTVDAYDILQKQINDYTRSLGSITASLQAIIADLQGQRVSLGEEATELTASLEDKAKRLFAQLSESGQNSQDTLKSNLTAINEVFAREGKAITDSFKKNTDKELDELRITIQSLKSCAETLLTLDESIKKTLNQINEMRREIAELKQALMDSQGSQDTILNDIQESIHALSEKENTSFSDLSQKLESSLQSSKEAQVASINGLKENIDTILNGQNASFSVISGNLESIKNEQGSTLQKMGSHIISNTSTIKQFRDSLTKENRVLRILSIVNIALVIYLSLHLLFS